VKFAADVGEVGRKLLPRAPLAEDLLRVAKKCCIIIFIFKRYIRAEVVTYRLDVAFGSLHTQQLHGFDELRNDQGIIQNRSAKIDKMTASFYLPSSHSSFRLLRLTQKNRVNNNRVFCRSD
jgi:hypothetical protein